MRNSDNKGRRELEKGLPKEMFNRWLNDNRLAPSSLSHTNIHRNELFESAIPFYNLTSLDYIPKRSLSPKTGSVTSVFYRHCESLLFCLGPFSNVLLSNQFTLLKTFFISRKLRKGDSEKPFNKKKLATCKCFKKTLPQFNYGVMGTSLTRAIKKVVLADYFI